MKKFLSILLVLIFALSLVGCGEDTPKEETKPKEEEEFGDKTLEELEKEKNDALINSFKKVQEEIKEHSGAEFKTTTNLSWLDTSTQEGTSTKYQLALESTFKEKYFNVLDTEEKIEVSGELSIDLNAKLTVTINNYGLENSTVLKFDYSVFIKDNIFYIYMGPNAILKTAEMFYKIDISKTPISEIKTFFNDLIKENPEKELPESIKIEQKTLEAFLYFLDTLMNDPNLSIIDNQAVYEYTLTQEVLTQNIDKAIDELMLKLEIEETKKESYKTSIHEAIEHFNLHELSMKLANNELQTAEEISFKVDLDIVNQDKTNNLQLETSITKQDFTKVEIIIPDGEYVETTWEDIKIKLQEVIDELKEYSKTEKEPQPE